MHPTYCPQSILQKNGKIMVKQPIVHSQSKNTTNILKIKNLAPPSFCYVFYDQLELFLFLTLFLVNFNTKFVAVVEKLIFNESFI